MKNNTGRPIIYGGPARAKKFKKYGNHLKSEIFEAKFGIFEAKSEIFEAKRPSTPELRTKTENTAETEAQNSEIHPKSIQNPLELQ